MSELATSTVVEHGGGGEEQVAVDIAPAAETLAVAEVVINSLVVHRRCFHSITSTQEVPPKPVEHQSLQVTGEPERGPVAEPEPVPMSAEIIAVEENPPPEPQLPVVVDVAATADSAEKTVVLQEPPVVVAAIDEQQQPTAAAASEPSHVVSSTPLAVEEEQGRQGAPALEQTLQQEAPTPKAKAKSKKGGAKETAATPSAEPSSNGVEVSTYSLWKFDSSPHVCVRRLRVSLQTFPHYQ